MVSAPSIKRVLKLVITNNMIGLSNVWKIVSPLQCCTVKYCWFNLLLLLFCRSPLEVLQYGQYSREGDVYMLAMAIYEYYMGLEINLENPASSFMKCVPFCRVPKKEVIFITTSFVPCLQTPTLTSVYSSYTVV